MAENRKPALPWWTWVLPFLIFHLGTGLSLHFQVARGLSLWYLPIPLGMILVQWWGPRVLLGLYLNALISAGYWGLFHWWFWPLYALPETFKVGLSWLLFAKLGRGKCWLPDLQNTWKFLLLGIVIPSLLTSFYGQAQFVFLGDASPLHYWRTAYQEFVLDILNPFAVSVPVLLFATSALERGGLSLTRGAHPRRRLLLPRRWTPLMRYEAAGVFAALAVLSLYLSLDRDWFFLGIFVLWASLRFGIGMAAVASLWCIVLTLLLPAILMRGFGQSWLAQADVARINLNLAVLCVAALVVGRALSDVYEQMESRNEAERSLLQSEAKYRTLFDSANDAIIISEDGVVIDCNRRSLELFRTSREAMIGVSVLELFPPTQNDGRPSHEKIPEIRSQVLAGRNMIVELKGRRLDGSEFDIEASLSGVDLGGRKLLFSVARDITERKGMQKSLAEKEGRYRTLFDSANDAIVLAEKGVIIDCNYRSTEVFRCPRSQMIGSSVMKFFPPLQADGRPTEARIREARETALGGRAHTGEWLHMRSDGTTFESEASLNPVVIEGRLMLQVVIRDLSERKRMERALLESEERFRQMAESIQEIFFLLDRATQSMLYISPVSEAILGVPMARIIAQPFSLETFMVPDDRDRIGFSRDGGWYQRPFNEDFRFIRPDGKTLWLRLQSFLIRDRGGEVFRVAGVVSDITEYKSAQESSRVHQQQLVQADKMNSLGMMVSGVAHEINNPNNLIMLNADVLETFWKQIRPVLRQRAADDPGWTLSGLAYGNAEGKIDALLNGLTGGSRRIKRIVDNLKDFARLDAGDMEESIALEKVVEASVGIVENLIRKSTDHFTVTHGQNLPRVKGNFQKLEQVIINLITNACQALDNRDKAVRIDTWFEAERGEVAIRVEDEGRGIPKDLIGKVADPFFTTKRDSGGTGLGLSVSYGIIKEHRGNIDFRSEVDRGTSVEIRIPAQAGKA